MKSISKLAFIIFIISAFTVKLNAQFEAGGNYFGPSFGLSFLGSTVQFGLNYEHGFNLKQIGINGPGTIGAGALFRYWGYSENFGSHGKWKYTNVLLGAQGNYHFDVNKKVDPWLGLVFAWNAGSVKWDGEKGEFSEPSHGGFWLGLHAGIRYFLSPKIALNARIGLGTLSYQALDIGVDFRL